MIAATCSCGKQNYASDNMAGKRIHCFRCNALVTLPLPAGVSVNIPAPLFPEDFVVPSQEQANVPSESPTTRRYRDALYWVLLLAVLPLVSALFHEADPSPLERLGKTMKEHPELRPLVESLVHSQSASVDDLFKLLPGGRIDAQAHLPRKTYMHIHYAIWAATGFFILVGVCMAGAVASPWKLALAASFTGTFGIACLFIFHDVIGPGHQLGLRSEQGFVVNLIFFTLVVGLGEELCKALVVIYYLRTDPYPTWRGALFWGLASGVGFGISEAISYAATQYNGIATGDIYLVRFISCVALHAVWSGLVSIALFQSRRLVGQVVGAILYLGNLKREEVITALVRVLGIPMLMHGAYDALLTQRQLVPALLVALVSFGWLGWQIESAREKEAPAPSEAGAVSA